MLNSPVRINPSRHHQIYYKEWINQGALLRLAEGSGRTKRELRFPKGGSFVAAVALSSFLPKGPTDGLVHFVEFDLGFPFPEQFSIGKKTAEKKIGYKKWYGPKQKPSKRIRTKRNLKEQQRMNLISKLEDVISRIGFDGFSCVSRLRCELRTVSTGNSLLEQLLVALFKPSLGPTDNECEKHRRTCQISLLQILMHSEEMQQSS